LIAEVPRVTGSPAASDGVSHVVVGIEAAGQPERAKRGHLAPRRRARIVDRPQ